MTREQRELELFRLPLNVLLKEYKRIKGIPDDTQSAELTAIRVGTLIQTILDAEFPKRK